MRCNAPSPTKKSLVFKDFFHSHRGPSLLQPHTDIRKNDKSCICVEACGFHTYGEDVCQFLRS